MWLLLVLLEEETTWADDVVPLHSKVVLLSAAGNVENNHITTWPPFLPFLKQSWRNSKHVIKITEQPASPRSYVE